MLGQSLEILEIGEEDAGEYICEVETFGPPLDQLHTLEVLGQYSTHHRYFRETAQWKRTKLRA